MRALETCPYRDQTGATDAPGDAACSLLLELTGLEDRDLCRVGRDACGACCRGPLPSPHRINPVIASLLSKIASGLIASGGRPGCDVGEAEALGRWAEEQISIAFPEDADPVHALVPRAVDSCHHRGEELPRLGSAGPEVIDGEGDRAFECRHPAHTTTTLDGCHLCRDWARRPGPAPAPLDRLLPPPETRCGPTVRSWAVGVTTAPREPSTLDWSIDSLARAGWPAPRLFEDTAVCVARRSAHLAVSPRQERLGAWPNFYLALIELLMREPDVDAYLMVEDDVLYYDRQDVRAYLERALWPGNTPGLVSLYCPAAYSRPDAGWHRHEGEWTLGAVAWIFPTSLAKRFVTDPLVLEHRWCGPAGGLAGVGMAVGSWAFRNGIPIHYPCPSLAQHIGDRSTIWPANRATGDRRADRFLGDLDLDRDREPPPTPRQEDPPRC